jgi:hypothetical protein
MYTRDPIIREEVTVDIPSRPVTFSGMKKINTYTTLKKPLFCMETSAAWADLPGTTTFEKIASLGIAGGKRIDIRELDTTSREYGIEIFLFFEKDLVHTSTIEQVIEEYRDVPEFERPYIPVDRFIDFTRENDPSFAQTIAEFPLMIDIVVIGDMKAASGEGEVPFISGLMPFLDELDVDAGPPHVLPR